ncbi:hypothetical protein [Streptomyces sp. NPDC002490]|uniref:hypothetical protein n=1 Tax=Streptomyces sp. NPDC002490 TaxID=3154416 RepID=UPI00331CC715
MRQFPWSVFALALVVNGATSFTMDGLARLVTSLVTAVLVLASGAALFTTRRRGPPVRSGDRW